jgi:hypothetical protein
MEKKRCLVLMPIGVTRRQEGPTFAAIYQHVLVPALQAAGFPLDIFRGDEVMRSGLNLYQGRLWLQEPHLVLADLTTCHSGVVHDLVLRDFLAHRTLLLSQRAADIPSRFSVYRRIIYCLSETGIAQLRWEIARHVGAILAATTPAAYPTGHGADDG